MPVASDNSTTKAVAWVVERLSAASDSGFWAEKISTLTSSRPAYPAPTGRPVDTNSRAESAVNQLSARVADLEAHLAALQEKYDTLSQHVEEAVGPHSEGEHKSHWWSRKH